MDPCASNNYLNAHRRARLFIRNSIADVLSLWWVDDNAVEIAIVLNFGERQNIART